MTIVLIGFGVLIIHPSLGVLRPVLRMHLRMLLGRLRGIHLSKRGQKSISIITLK